MSHIGNLTGNLPRQEVMMSGADQLTDEGRNAHRQVKQKWSTSVLLESLLRHRLASLLLNAKGVAVAP
jgi:hypothetical protein